MKPVREKALAAICRRYSTHPRLCGWETPDRDRLITAMDAFLSEFETNRPAGLHLVGEAEEATAGRALASIANAGTTDMLKMMSPEDVAVLRTILRTARDHVAVMSAHHKHWPEAPQGLSDWDLALFVLAHEAIHI